MRFSGTFKGRHRSGAARAEAPLRQAATPRNWLRGRCVEQPVLSNKEIPLSVPEDRPGQVPEARPGQVPGRPARASAGGPARASAGRPARASAGGPHRMPARRPGSLYRQEIYSQARGVASLDPPEMTPYWTVVGRFGSTANPVVDAAVMHGGREWVRGQDEIDAQASFRGAFKAPGAIVEPTVQPLATGNPACVGIGQPPTPSALPAIPAPPAGSWSCPA